MLFERETSGLIASDSELLSLLKSIGYNSELHGPLWYHFQQYIPGNLHSESSHETLDTQQFGASKQPSPKEGSSYGADVNIQLRSATPIINRETEAAVPWTGPYGITVYDRPDSERQKATS